MIQSTATEKMLKNILDGTTPPKKADAAQRASGDEDGRNIKATYVEKTAFDGLSEVAKSGKYSDLSGIPPAYKLPEATTAVLGGVKLDSSTVQSVPANSPSSITGRTYPIQKNSSGQLVVNVPWVDTIGDFPTRTLNNKVITYQTENLTTGIKSLNVDLYRQYSTITFVARQASNTAEWVSVTLPVSVWEDFFTSSNSALKLSGSDPDVSRFLVLHAVSTFSINIDAVGGYDQLYIYVCRGSSNA